MSGGVDSSLAAALAVEAGHTVVGIMLRLWVEPGAAGSNKCCTLEAVEDARAVADHLGIPFTVIDAADFFRQAIVADFVDRARRGETPNPCFSCNRRVRFGFLLERAMAVGADLLATGHYAQVERGADDRMRLLRGADRDKDQSYVLHRLSQSQLRHAIFPVGDLSKDEVRRLAAERGLATASRKDSVDLCWVGKDGVGGFISRSLGAELAAGDIVDASGRVLGRHSGLERYTLGQRRGLGVAAGEPVYVTERDFSTNRLVVGSAHDLAAVDVRADDLHWIDGPPSAGQSGLTAKIRYGAPDAAIEIVGINQNELQIRFGEPVRAPTPGQGLVIYDRERVVGGGVIRARD